MSDGPHRSLPLKKHWKRVAERAATPSYTLSEVAATLPNALLCDLREAPVSQVVDILFGRGQPSLFHENCVDELEALRGTCRGSTAGTTLIDCAIEAKTVGLGGAFAVNTVLINTLEALARGYSHSIEEHYHRKKPWSVPNIRTRLKEARASVSFATLASEITSGNAASIAKLGVPKRRGIDEGPQL